MMMTIEKEYEICSEFKASDANNSETMMNRKGKFVDNWYVYTTPDVYKKLFNKTIQGKEKLPWKRKVVKIYSKDTKCSVYRIWRGTFRTVLAKDILYVDKDAKYILSNKDDKTSIILYPSNKFLYYWNHFAPEIRAPFKLGLISLLVSLVSLILGIISLKPTKMEKNLKDFSDSVEVHIEEEEYENSKNPEIFDNEGNEIYQIETQNILKQIENVEDNEQNVNEEITNISTESINTEIINVESDKN